jgi:hypothetical protein
MGKDSQNSASQSHHTWIPSSVARLKQRGDLLIRHQQSPGRIQLRQLDTDNSAFELLLDGVNRFSVTGGSRN